MSAHTPMSESYQQAEQRLARDEWDTCTYRVVGGGGPTTHTSIHEDCPLHPEETK